MCAQTTTFGRSPLRCSRCAIERVERLDHVAVAQVPRRDVAAEHRAVVALGVLHQPRVLLGVEDVVLGERAARSPLLGGAPAQLDRAARPPPPRTAASSPRPVGIAVGLAVLAEVVEAGVALAARAAAASGSTSVEVAEHRLDRGVQAVQVEAVEADLARRSACASLCSRSQSTKSSDVGVAPHPGREARKPRSACVAPRVVAGAADVAVDAVGIRPVGLDGDGGEALLLDQPLGDRARARGRTRACRATPRRAARSGRRRSAQQLVVSRRCRSTAVRAARTASTRAVAMASLMVA